MCNMHTAVHHVVATLNPLLLPFNACSPHCDCLHPSIHGIASICVNVYISSCLLLSHIIKVSSLLKEAMEIRTNIESPGFLEEQTAQQSLEQLSEYEAQLKRLIEQARSYVEYHQHFGSIRTSKRHY